MYGGGPNDEMEAGRYDPYAVIRQFFLSMTMDEARQDLEDWFQAAFTEEYSWPGGSPGNLLFMCDEMITLAEAAHDVLLLFPEKEENGQLKKAPVPPEFNAYYYPDDFPRWLSAAEWSDPLIALRDIFGYKDLEDWKETLHIWLSASLSNESICGMVDPGDLLPVCRCLFKLVEASHAINFQREKGEEQL